MPDLRWTERPGEFESLAVSLRAILAGRGDERPYDELVSLLGLGAAIVAVPGECVGDWCSYARDAALADSAEMLGLRLRALHPPEAADGLDRSAEFARHFHDSYVPLMRAALQCGQELLAWCGWPKPAEHDWGVVTATRAGTMLGRTLDDGGQSAALTGPALQVYVVEEYRPPQSERRAPPALFAHAVRVARASWEGALPAGGVETGRRAYETWRAVALQPTPGPNCDHAAGGCQAHMVQVLTAARRSLATWLLRIAGDLESPQRQLAGEWAVACDRVSTRLQPFADEATLETRLAKAAGREKFAEVVAEVGRGEADVVTKLANLTTH